MRVVDAIAPAGQARYYIAVPVLNASQSYLLYRFRDTFAKMVLKDGRVAVFWLR